jgi:hypothetical protein
MTKQTTGEQSKTSTADRLKPYQFKPGQSGNPSGLPKGTVSIVAEIRKILRENPERLRALAEKVVERAERNIDGKEYVYVKEIIERMDGKVSDKTEIIQTSTDVTEFTIDDLKQFREWLNERKNIDNKEPQIEADAPPTSTLSKTDEDEAGS